jgi:hypothetical protein
LVQENATITKAKRQTNGQYQKQGQVRGVLNQTVNAQYTGVWGSITRQYQFQYRSLGQARTAIGKRQQGHVRNRHIVPPTTPQPSIIIITPIINWVSLQG